VAALRGVVGMPHGLPVPTVAPLPHRSPSLPPPSRLLRPRALMRMAGPRSWSRPRAAVDRATGENTYNALRLTLAAPSRASWVYADSGEFSGICHFDDISLLICLVALVPPPQRRCVVGLDSPATALSRSSGFLVPPFWNQVKLLDLVPRMHRDLSAPSPTALASSPRQWSTRRCNFNRHDIPAIPKSMRSDFLTMMFMHGNAARIF
jgi:hypothetical protein